MGIDNKVAIIGIIVNSFLLKLKRQTGHLDLSFYDLNPIDSFSLAMYIEANFAQTIWYPFNE